MAAPSPWAPPVTRATRPERSKVLLMLSFLQSGSKRASLGLRTRWRLEQFQRVAIRIVEVDNEPARIGAGGNPYRFRFEADSFGLQVGMTGAQIVHSQTQVTVACSVGGCLGRWPGMIHVLDNLQRLQTVGRHFERCHI